MLALKIMQYLIEWEGDGLMGFFLYNCDVDCYAWCQ